MMRRTTTVTVLPLTCPQTASALRLSLEATLDQRLLGSHHERMVLRVVATSLLMSCLLLAAAGCSSEPLDDDNGPGATIGTSAYPSYRPQSFAEFPAAFARGLCSALAQCCEGERLDFDQAACEAAVAPQITDEDDGQNLQTVFDPDRAAQCIDDWSNAACPSYPTLGFNYKHNCDVFRGLVPAGGACRSEIECAFGPGDDAVCSDGICEVLSNPHAKLSEPCGGTCRQESSVQGCEAGFAGNEDPSLERCYTREGLQCAHTGDTWTCQPLLDVGDSCADESQGCVHGAHCDRESLVCTLHSEDGPCGDDDACTPNAYCDLDLDHCVVSGIPIGEACNADQDCLSGTCNRFGFCIEVGGCSGVPLLQ